MKKTSLLIAVIASVLSAGCAAVPAAEGSEPTDRMASAQETTASTSVTVPLEERPLPGEDFFAWATYSRKKELIIFHWYDEQDAESYRFYDKSSGRLLGEAKGVDEYSVELKHKDVKDEMVFCAERVLSDGTAVMSYEIPMHKNEDGGLVLDYRDLDSDGDGLKDIDEIERGTKRFEEDTDGDGLCDGYELSVVRSDPLKKRSRSGDEDDGEADLEGDGLTNAEEYRYGTNPFNGDSDEDGFSDGYETKHGMDPLTPDPIVIDKDKVRNIKDMTIDEVLTEWEVSSYGSYSQYNDYGNIRWLEGAFNNYTMDNALDAMYMIYSVKSLIGVDDPAEELVFSRSMINDTTDSYSFSQTYKGIPVRSGTVTVHKSKLNGHTTIQSGYIPKEVLDNINVVPTITEDDLLGIAIEQADRPPTKIYGIELYITKDFDTFKENYDPTPYLAYHFTTDQHQGIVVDAHTGKITSQGNTFVT